MLQITLDIFSGRPNPSWILDEQDAREILKNIAKNRGVVTEVDSGYQGLGYRGLILESLTDHVAAQYDLPSMFEIANGASLYESKADEIAEHLISTMPSDNLRARGTEQPVEFDERLKQQLLDHLGTFPKLEIPSELDSSERSAASSTPDETAAQTRDLDKTCLIENAPYKPDFWNNANHLKLNNCYNYAVNIRTDTFAQPGRATGRYPYAKLCHELTTAVLSDGNHKRFDCLPESEKPRHIMALVLCPVLDYHWYRKHREGFWAHKPGVKPVRNVDNSGQVIYNPETCDRTSGFPPYVEFCGYFYRPKSVRVK
jgi:hypothetical protein